jgi:hypothetical protein
MRRADPASGVSWMTRRSIPPNWKVSAQSNEQFNPAVEKSIVGDHKATLAETHVDLIKSRVASLSHRRP